MSDGITDAYRQIVTTKFFAHDKTFTCKECGAKDKEIEHGWYDGKKYYIACDDCLNKFQGITMDKVSSNLQTIINDYAHVIVKTLRPNDPMAWKINGTFVKLMLQQFAAKVKDNK